MVFCFTTFQLFHAPQLYADWQDFYLLQELRIQTMLSVPAQRSPAVYHYLQKCIMQLGGGGCLSTGELQHIHEVLLIQG